MPGTITVRPVYANMTSDISQKNDIYLKLSLGSSTAKTGVVKNSNQNPKWEETVTLDKKDSDNVCFLEMKNKDGFLFDSSLGEAKIDLNCVMTSGKVTQWYNLVSSKKQAGEILLDITYQA